MERITRLLEEDKCRYEKEKQQLQEKTQDKKKKTTPQSPYLVFCEQQRKIQPKITMKELGMKWSVVKQEPAEFQKYQEMYKELHKILTAKEKGKELVQEFVPELVPT